MKYFVCTSLLFVISLTASSQDQPLRTEEYCEIEVEWIFGSPLCHIRVDYGQYPHRGLINSVDKLRDSMTRRPLEFNSPVDALNYMNEQGWELVQAYSSDSCDTRYLMRRSLLESAAYETTPR
ncbi:MAG: hypothetical protein AAF944_22900 [Bacteroidota bacterium]